MYSPSGRHVENTIIHLLYSAHLRYTDVVYTKCITEIHAVVRTIVLAIIIIIQPLLHSDSFLTLTGYNYT